jgi:hypothetical protein
MKEQEDQLPDTIKTTKAKTEGLVEVDDKDEV